MLSRSFRRVLFLSIAVCLASFGFWGVNVRAAGAQSDALYSQPVDPAGKLFPSSWRDPDGSDNDQYVWDEFTLQSDAAITGVEWYGGYDPLLSGKGGPVLDFSVSIYPSIAAGTEPAVAAPPLVTYRTGGNAGETAFGTFNGTPINRYAFSLPVPFPASAGVKYWVQIEGSQQGSLPDWGFAAGQGAGNHYIRTSGAGGDVMYRFAPGEAAFTLTGSAFGTATPTPAAPATITPPAPSTPTPAPAPQAPNCLSAVLALPMFALLFRLSRRFYV